VKRTFASLLLGAAISLAAPAAEAAGDPQLDWWTVHTKHFHVHYARGLEPVADRVAALAETIHERLTVFLGYEPKSYTEIVLTDDTDSANGSATALPYNTIRLFVTAPDDLSPLGDYDDWYLELLTHEYTHIVHTDNISGVPAIVNAVLGKTYSPNQAQPRWILEGLAVVSESQHTSAGRIRSSLWDMYLRADVLDDRIAGIDQFSSNAYRYPQGNLWYIYGSRFLRWITDVYGPDTMRAVSADYGATLVPWGINRAIRRVTGKTYVELFEGFKDYIRRRYADQMREVDKRGLREGVQITHHGRTVSYPRFVPAKARAGAGEELLFFRDDQDERSGLYRLPLAGGEKREELVARTNGPSSATFTPEGDLVFHSVSIFRNLYGREDLFRLPRGETSPGGEERARRQLTVGRRASTADVSPDGRQVTFVVNNKGTTYLEIADVAPDGTVKNLRDLVPSARFEQAYTPRFSPDGAQVAYSVWTAGGYRDVRLVDVATGRFEQITHDRSLDMTPIFSADGKTLYFVSDRTGIFNVYAYDLAARTLAQVTNVRVGAVQPTVSADGKTLVYVGYTTYGFDLFRMPLDPARFLPAVPPPTDRPDPPAEPIGVERHFTPYNPLPTLAPRHYLMTIKPGSYSSVAFSFTASTSDVVGIHGVDLSLLFDPKAPSPTVSVGYSYDRLPVDFNVRLFHQSTPRGDYAVNDKTVPYDETTNGITTGVSYGFQGDFTNHNIGMSFSVANFFGSLPVGSALDPYSRVRSDPPRGNINVAHVGYSFSNAEGSNEAAGNVRGASFSIGLDYAGPYTGSSFAIRNASASFVGYLSMPWPGHQTMAIRTSGAVSAGDYPRNGAYAVGGYDLENNSLPSTILSGVFNGSFALRGYPPRAYAGASYFLQNVEYRIPIVKPDHGISSLPLYLRRIDGNLFWDYGGAFDNFRWDKFAVFRSGEILYAPQLHTAVGGEIWLGATIGYQLNVQLRIGYAHGFSPEAYHAGQPYFVASSAF
jgi:WD40-like Beta Propeller Repeat